MAFVMVRLANSILDLIGNTPLVRLNKSTAGIKAQIFAKLEFLNPGGSVKDRIGTSMIEAAEKEGLLKPGYTIVEPTSGNTGVGLALVAALRGYKMIFIIPDKMSSEKINLLKAYGAKVIITPTAVAPEDPRSYYKIAEKLAKKPKHFSPNQYWNKFNPIAHYKTTGPEIWEQTSGKITHFVAGIGTGGTISGIAKYLKEQNPKIKIIGADPEGSLYHHHFYKTKGEVHTYKIEGIGEDFIPGTVDLGLIDEIVTVTDKQAYSTARRLAKEEGLLVGSSSGAAVYAALKVGRKMKKNDHLVVLLPDTGRNYLSKVFNDEWMRQNGFLGGRK